MIKSEHLQQAVDGLQQRFVAKHGHEALLPRRKLRASFAATLCCLLLYLSGFRKAELVAYMPERATLFTGASLLRVIWSLPTKQPTTLQLQAPSRRAIGAKRRPTKASVTPQAKSGVTDQPLLPSPMCQATQRGRALADFELAYSVDAERRS
eukprot:2140194-Pleurochrysis_carterae.AAC.2